MTDDFNKFGAVFAQPIIAMSAMLRVASAFIVASSTSMDKDEAAGTEEFQKGAAQEPPKMQNAMRACRPHSRNLSAGSRRKRCPAVLNNCASLILLWASIPNNEARVVPKPFQPF